MGPDKGEIWSLLLAPVSACCGVFGPKAFYELLE